MYNKIITVILFFTPYTILSMQDQNNSNLIPSYSLLSPAYNQQPIETLQQLSNVQDNQLFHQPQSAVVAPQAQHYYPTSTIFNYLLLLQQSQAAPQPSQQASFSNTEKKTTVQNKQMNQKTRKKTKSKKKEENINASALVSCPECKTILRAASLKVHIRTHTKETPYHCLICKQSSNYLSNMIRHTQSIKHIKKLNSKMSCPEKKRLLHEETMPEYEHVCKHCYIAFDYKEELATHPCKYPQINDSEVEE